MDIASLGVRISSDGAEKGTAALDEFVVASERAESAEAALEKQSRDTSKAVGQVGDAAEASSSGLSALQASTQELAKAEAEAQARIKDVVKRSLEKQQAMLAAASATHTAAQASEQASRSFNSIGADKLGNSFAAAQSELDAFSDALAHQAQSLEDVGEVQAWATDLYDRGLLSLQDYEAAGKSLEKQERNLARAQADHARQVQALLRQYDPASAAIAKIAADERLLNEALRAGAITQLQYSKAMAGLTVNRTRWLAEAKGVDELSKKINYMGLASNAAFRDYATLISALGRGDIGLAGNQFLQLGSRIGALRLLMNPVAIGIGAIAGAVGLLTYSVFNGEKELYGLEKALILSGNAAGITAGQAELLADQLDDISTKGNALKVLTALAASGEVASENFQNLAETALLLERIGQPLEDTVRTFKELGRDPVEASKKLNKEYGYLTAAVLKQITELQRQGRIEEAGALAQKTYAEEFKKRADKVQENLGYLQTAAQATSRFFKDMWDRVLDVGRPDTLEEQIAHKAEQLRQLQDYIQRFPVASRASNPNIDQERTELATELRALQARSNAAKRQAEQDRKNRETNAAAIAAEDQAEKLRNSNLERSLAERERALSGALAGYSAYESQLEALRSGGLVSENDYYAAKRELVSRIAVEQVKAVDAENALLRAENQRREKDKEAQPEIIANQIKIADNEQKKREIRIKAAKELGALTIEERNALDEIQRGYDRATASAQAYLEVVQQQRQRSLAAFGKGTRQREFDDGANEIDDRFAQERRRLDDQLAQRHITQAQYDKRLQSAQDFRDKDRQDYERYWEDLTELQGNWLLGAEEAFANFSDAAANVAGQTEDLFTNAFEGMTDALVEFARTGKLDFKSLAESIIADLLRIQLQSSLVNIFGSIGGLFGPKAIGGTGAGGGTVPSGGGTLFADTGIKRVPRDNQPAILHKDEAVLPASMNPYAGGSMGPGVSVTQNLYPAPGTDNGQFYAMLQQAKAEIMNELLDGSNRQRYASVLG